MKTPIDSAAAGAGATVALLNGGADFAMIDLWKITLNGGAVVRWHGGPLNAPISFTAAAGQSPSANGTYLAGPVIDRGKISNKLGLEVATVDMKIGASSTAILAGTAAGTTCTIQVLSTASFRIGGALAISGCAPAAYNGGFSVTSLTTTSITYSATSAPGGPMTSLGVCGGADQVNGAPLVPFAQGRGFDGASVVLYRAFLPAWGAANAAPQITGAVIAFSGRVTELKDVSRAGFTMTVSAWTVLLNVNMGPDVFQAGCLNTHYDADCGLPITANGTVAAGASTTAFNSSLAEGDHYFDKGTVTFTSGVNTGLTRVISSYLAASGAITLASALPTAPSSGDAFTASIQIPGTVASATSGSAFDTNLTSADHYFDKGTLTFTSGANAGLSRTVQTYLNASGALSFAFGFPNPPAPGDTFTALRGCLLTLADCEAQRPVSDAQSHFRGQPFTPPAVQAIA